MQERPLEFCLVAQAAALKLLPDVCTLCTGFITNPSLGLTQPGYIQHLMIHLLLTFVTPRSTSDCLALHSIKR
jgi:hypothetical protein